MASIEQVGRQVRGALDRLPFRQLADAASDLDAASVTMRETMAGSSDSEAAEVVGNFQLAVSLVREAHQLVVLVQSRMQAYVDQLGGGAASPPTDSAGSSGTSSTPGVRDRDDVPARPSKPDGQRLTREQAVKLQGELPPPVVSRTGQKTHGRWIDEHGQAQPIVSGQDEDSAAVWETLQRLDIPAPGPPTSVSDVEQKLAIRMVRDGRKHVDVIINNQPCAGRYGCDILVPVILPAGYSLTVHAPNYRKTYTGGAKPPWL